LNASSTQPLPPPCALPIATNSSRQRAPLPKLAANAELHRRCHRLAFAAEAVEVQLVQEHRIGGDQLLAFEAVQRESRRVL
jgi:hypothetical protein